MAKQTELQKLAKKDLLMKTKYRHNYRSDMWCHSNTGDDYITRVYTDVIPTKEQIKEVVGKVKFDSFTTIQI